MATVKKTIALGASAAMALSGLGATFAMANPGDPDGQSAGAAQKSTTMEMREGDIVPMPKAVIGEFTFCQTEVATNEELAARLAGASKYLCGSQLVEQNQGVAPEEWEFAITGSVRHPEVMSLGEYLDSDRSETVVMGCTCLGNPVDGNATANAKVTGLPIRELMAMVEPDEGVSTMVLVSADGYEVALPYTYVVQRRSSIVFAVNGAPLAESVGGSNQLWLGSTPASYFARDIVEIRLEDRQTPPPSPSSAEARAAYQNLPNIGVLYGGKVR